MKKIGFRLTGLVTLLLVTALSVSVYAQRQGAGPRGGQGQGQRCEKIPGITDEQKTAIHDLRTEFMQSMTQHRADVGVLHAELKKLQVADNPDQKAIDAKIDELFALKAQAAKAKNAHRQKVRSLLTDEQKVFFDAHAGNGYGHGKGYGKGQGNGPRNGRGNGQGNGPGGYGNPNCIKG